MKKVIGYYNERLYRIEIDGKEVYQAGNAPFESQTYLSPEDGVGRRKMRSYCISTAHDIADENDAEYMGVEYEEID